MRCIGLILDNLMHKALLLRRETTKTLTSCTHTCNLGVVVNDITANCRFLVQAAWSLLEYFRVSTHVYELVDSSRSHFITEDIHMVMDLSWMVTPIPSQRGKL